MIVSFFQSSIISGLTSVLAYLITIFFARSVDEIIFSNYVYAILWSLILNQIIDFSGIKSFSDFSIRNNIKFDFLFTTIYVGKLILVIILFSLIFVLNKYGLLKIPIESFFFIVPSLYLASVFELRNKNIIYALILLVEKILFLTFSYFYIRNIGFNVIIYISFFIISIASLTVQFSILGIGLPKLSNFKFDVLKKYFKSYWKLFLTLIVQSAYGHYSRIIIEAKMGLIIFTSVSLAMQIVNSFAMFQVQIDRHIRPILISSVIKKDNKSLIDNTIIYLKIYVIPAFFICISIYLFSEHIIAYIFDDKWKQVSGFLNQLLPLIIIYTILRYVEILAVALGETKYLLISNIICAFLLVLVLTIFNKDTNISYYLLAITSAPLLNLFINTIIVSSKFLRSNS